MKASQDLWKERRARYSSTDVNQEETFTSKAMGGRTEKIILRAKFKQRSDLNYKRWNQYNHVGNWKTTKDMLARQNESLVSEQSFSNKKLPCISIERILAGDYTLEAFQKAFEAPSKPCIIQGACDKWPARVDWDFTKLREKCGEMQFKCGEDDDGNTVRIKLKHFFRYMFTPMSENIYSAKADDSPLYIFEPDVEEWASVLLTEYDVPHMFQEDLFQYVGSEDRRPPYRWMLFGPERSGTTLHIDPLGTSAWNSLIEGRKLWIMFQPVSASASDEERDEYMKLVKAKKYRFSGEDDEAIDYFTKMIPRMLAQNPSMHLKMMRFIQEPGETVFVPSNWWHAVLNLDDTIAVTQNFCSTGNFDEVWRRTRIGRTKLAKEWLKNLRSVRPDLYIRAERMNSNDSFSLEAVLERRKNRKERNSKKNAMRKMGVLCSSDSESTTSSESSDSEDESDSESAQGIKQKKSLSNQNDNARSKLSPSDMQRR